MAFATMLRRLREGKGWTQAQLATAAGMSQRGISHIEQGLRDPGWDTVQKLASALGVGVEEFTKADDARDEKPGRGRPAKPKADESEAKPAKAKPAARKKGNGK